MINPLREVIFEIIMSNKVWKVHTLAAELNRLYAMPVLDPQPEQDLFKRNFLIMNALYQLQQQLKPDYLHVSPMHIELFSSSCPQPISINEPLQEYYLDWQNYQTSTAEINQLLDNFWQRFKGLCATPSNEVAQHLIHQWQLPQQFTLKELQKRWRQLALQAHPDKTSGSAEQFKQLKKEYEQLKFCCSS